MDVIGYYMVSGIVTASILSLPAAGVSLIYGIMGYPNFSVGEFMTFGAYMAFLFSSKLGLPFPIAAALSMAAAGILAVAIDQALFRPVRSEGILPPILLSVGVMIFLRNMVRFFWGNEPRQFDLPLVQPFHVFGLTVTSIQTIGIGLAVLFLGLFHLILARTTYGKSIRATADNSELAIASGVQTEQVAAGVLFFSGALAGLGGVILGMESTLTPMMGWYNLLPIFAVAILGGLGSMLGTAAAALVVGLAQELSLMVIPSSYKIAVAFIVLAFILFLRPTGIIGRKVTGKT